MTCKHRWEEVIYMRGLTPNHYTYKCVRCNQFTSALLKEKT